MPADYTLVNKVITADGKHVKISSLKTTTTNLKPQQCYLASQLATISNSAS